MDIKEVIDYIAKNDLEINLTFQVGSGAEELQEELQQLRRRIDELQMNGTAQISEESTDEKADAEHETAEARDEDSEMQEAVSSEEKIEELEKEDEVDPEEADEEFDEMFGNDPVEEPRDPEDIGGDEPTEEDRTEAGADFNELFGDV